MQVGGDSGDGGGGGGGGGGGEVIRKGPWMAEEDEILMDYVRKYGPREWSSIRSKGLLPRTGKSCRLRWVNKLKPDLKTGCKFSPEEERIVIDLQARLGNKWARIATYLPGRTDNDVKNFWSTRQKRLARILRTPLLPSTKSRNNAVSVKSEEAPSFKESPGEEPSQGQCSSRDGHHILHQDTNLPLLETTPLPLINPLPSPLLDISQLPSGPEFVQGFCDMNLQYEFAGQEHSSHSQCMDFSEDLQFFGLEVGQQGIRKEVGDAGEAPDGFFDDLPMEMFDYLDHPPTSSSPTW